MTTQQLECFIRVADKLNFTKAAQEMFLTTPTVTHQMIIIKNSNVNWGRYSASNICIVAIVYRKEE